jgi:hypothetical protein
VVVADVAEKVVLACRKFIAGSCDPNAKFSLSPKMGRGWPDFLI